MMQLRRIGSTGMIRWPALFVTAMCLTFAACARQPAPSYDLVIANGRVMDPESGLDAVRHVGIRGGKIEAVSATPLTGARVIDASRHVVAPGFIDLHEHGQQEESYRMMVRDGVTSAFELEVGTGDVAAWYAARERRPDRQLRRVRRTHPGAHEGAGRSRHGTAAGRHRRQRDRRPTRRWRRWRRFCAKGWRRARSPWASAARTRQARRCRRSSACSASPPRAASSAHIHMRGGVEGPAGDDRRGRRRARPAAHRPRQLVRRHRDRRVSRARSRPRATPDRT